MNLTFIRSEIVRTVRNPRYLVFALGMPVLFYWLFGAANSKDHLSGLTVSAYVMVSMGTFGAMSGVFSTGGRIAVERESGWNRHLRLTALSGRQYVLGKAVTGFAVAVPSVVLVFAAAAMGGVHLALARWAAVGLSVLLAMAPISALGIWVGFMGRADSLQAVSGGVYSLLALLGGLWVPIESFPGWLAALAKSLPMYWVAGAGRAAIAGRWVGLEGVAVLVAWTVGLGALAARAYQRDTARA